MAQENRPLFHGSDSFFTAFSDDPENYGDGVIFFTHSPLLAGCFGKFVYACYLDIEGAEHLDGDAWASNHTDQTLGSLGKFLITQNGEARNRGGYLDDISSFVAVPPASKILIVRRFELRDQLAFDDVGEFARARETAPRICNWSNPAKSHSAFQRAVTKVNEFWVDSLRDYFVGKSFKLRVDAGLSLRAAVRDLLRQARARQAEFAGSRYEGAMLQHLVGAKLELVLPPGSVIHHSASEADQADGRAGDFLVGDVAIHATTHPSEALIQKCAGNLEAGLRPLIVTLPARTAVADDLSDAAGIALRVDILDIEQFLAANLHERSHFEAKGRHSRTTELVANYNRLIDAHETDPSLRIEIAGRAN